MQLGKPDAVKPPVWFDEGRGETVIGLVPLNPTAPPTLLVLFLVFVADKAAQKRA